MTVYRYGWLAWVWRLMGIAALAAVGFLAAMAVKFGSWSFAAMALPLALPLVLLPMVATRVEVEGDTVRVATLAFLTRVVDRRALGRPRARRKATALLTRVHAPRIWVPVRGGLPIYLDLLADVPDPPAFRRVFPLPRDMARNLGSDP